MPLSLGLVGCVTDGTVQTLKPICDALIGPIHYSSTTNKYQRYAGKQLASDLAERNRVGVNLGCPAYR